MQRTILLVDANETDRIELCKELRTYFNVIEANGNEDAIRLIVAQYAKLSAVVVCIEKAAADAFPILKELRAHAILTQLPALVVAKVADADAEFSVLEGGVSDYISRQTKPEIIRQRIRNLINLREMSALGNEYRKTKQSVQRMQAVMACLDCGVAAAKIDDEAAQIVFSNDRFYEIFGYNKTRYEAKFQNSHGPILAEDMPMVQRACEKAGKNQQPVELIFRAEHANGAIIWVRQHVTFTRLMGVSGDVQLGIFYDITAEMQAFAKDDGKETMLSKLQHDLHLSAASMLV